VTWRGWGTTPVGKRGEGKMGSKKGQGGGGGGKKPLLITIEVAADKCLAAVMMTHPSSETLPP